MRGLQGVRFFIDGSRELHSGMGRPVHAINAVSRVRAKKFRSSGSFRAGRRDGAHAFTVRV